MRQITVSVPDHRLPFFMELVNALDFVQIVNQEELEGTLTDAQKKAWEDVKAGFEEEGQEEDEEDKSQARPVETLLNGLD